MRARFDEKNKSAISAYVRTKTVSQVRSHMQKFKARMVVALCSTHIQERMNSAMPSLPTTSIETTQSLGLCVMTREKVSDLPDDSTEISPERCKPVSERNELRYITPLECTFPSSYDNNNNDYSPFSSFCIYWYTLLG